MHKGVGQGSVDRDGSPRRVVSRSGLRAALSPVVAIAFATVFGIAFVAVAPEVHAQTSSNTAPTVPPSQTIPRPAPSPSPRPATRRTTKKRVTTAKPKPKTTVPSTATSQDGSVRATVTGAGAKGVAVRDAPAITGTLMSRKPEGTILRVACEAPGEAVKDLTSGRSSAVWVKLTSGGFVASIYTTAFEAGKIGDARKLPACNADGTTPSTIAVATTKKPASSTAPAPASSDVVGVKGAVSTVAP
jgi:hypothetical protein